ncbi:DNA polymerase alpha-associated DNA helicase A-like protein [Acrodontium crateriforme]|uniref:DNA helicase n=1 Tax=Acrodontium crateriforme TaxID=150365 RepID=A0AAQ3M7J7_9PEZI|nr:DNA polymerase alpha-associated DNA helicase A-like protein [Acrodontium crateriforme]
MAPPKKNGVTPSAIDKLLFIPKIFIILTSAFTRLITAPLLGGPRANTAFKDFVFAALRTQLSWISVKQEQWLNSSTEKTYLDFAKGQKLEPSTQDIRSGLKMFWLGPRDAKKIIYYLHGGGYAIAASPGHFKWLFDLQNDLAKQSGKSVSVVVLGYTLSPYGQYPIQLREAAEGLQSLLDANKSPRDIIIAGDSAGGNLTMSLLSHILHPHPEVKTTIKLESPVAGVVLVSPWSKFTTDDDSVRRNATSDMVTPSASDRWVSLFLGSGPKDNYNQPGLAEQEWFTGLPDVADDILVWGGGGEILIDSIEALTKKLKIAQPKTELVVEPGAAHEDMIISVLLGYKDKSEGTKAIEQWVSERIYERVVTTTPPPTLLSHAVIPSPPEPKEKPRIHQLTMKATDIATFATSQISLLDNELQAELAETQLLTATHAPSTLQRAGLAVLNLTVSSQRTGFGGKTLLELGLDTAVGGGELPEHGLRVGDICAVGEQPKGAERKKEREGMEKRGVEGVVTRVFKEGIVVALDREDVDVPVGKLWLVKLANDVTYKRLNSTMTRLQKMLPSEHSSLTQVLFGQSSPTPVSNEEKQANIQWHDTSLNESQQEAIRFALASREIALIHGPPGTGKTHTLIELILQLLDRNQRILVCGPSNVSVDNIVERLAAHKVPMVRLGHPARLLPSVLNHSLEVLTKTSDAAAIVTDIRNEMDAKQTSIRKTRNGRERRAIYLELKDLRREYRQREAKVVGDLLRESRVVLSTLHGAGGYHLKPERFDVVIVDEASQALEAQCWIPVLASGASKLVLAGDHLQLPPTIKSLNMKDLKPAKKAEVVDATNIVDGTAKLSVGETKGSESKKRITLETTLFDRLLDLHGSLIKRMLTTQYRMHEKIMAFPSSALYEGKLIAAEAVRERLLKDLPYDVQAVEDTCEPLVFWDTQGGDFPEKTEDDESGAKGKSSLLAESKINEHEAALVRLQVSKLVEAGVKPSDIAIVTPYNGQLALLSQMLKERYEGLELGSVDGFQGREKEAVIVSLVRSNPEHEVGFLGEKRRLNVAMTRPKRHLCIIGDSDTVGRGSKFLRSWMGYLEEHADLRYPDPSDLHVDG